MQTLPDLDTTDRAALTRWLFAGDAPADDGAPTSPEGHDVYAVWANPVDLAYLAQLDKHNVYCQRCAYWGLRATRRIGLRHALRVTLAVPTPCDECHAPLANTREDSI